MQTLIVYDISNDALRTRLAEVLKDLGLERIQKSAFLGELSSQERKDLIEILKNFIENESDRIDIFVICERDMKLHIIIR